MYYFVAAGVAAVLLSRGALCCAYEAVTPANVSHHQEHITRGFVCTLQLCSCAAGHVVQYEVLLVGT